MDAPVAEKNGLKQAISYRRLEVGKSRETSR